jgi:ABC-type dipeptide/oligopeptide/nickel transport system permease subunit
MIAISRGWDGQPLWSKPALAGISNLDQFSSVIVFTESMDSARDWIEQVQPRLGAVPLLVASSAQTWPLLQPYSSSNQVKGLVAGISGGAAYEKILGKSNTGSDLWGLYLVGQFLAVLIILLGVVYRVYHENRSIKSKGKEI